MKAVKMIAMGAAGVAALVGAAAPASAQYYGSPYGGYQYGYPPNTIGQVIQSLINPYGQFGYGYGAVSPEVAVNQCTAAVQQRLAYQNRGYGNGYPSPYGYGNGYPSPYGYNNYNAYNNARILGVTRVEQRSATTIRVRGYATSGMNYGGPYGQYGYGGYGANGYGYSNGYGNAQPADLSFKCDVDYRGYIRNVDISRRHY